MLSVDGPVKQRLETLAGELAKAADKELQVCCRRSCGHDLIKKNVKNSFYIRPCGCILNSCRLVAFK